jgi:hypothetical protein
MCAWMTLMARMGEWDELVSREPQPGGCELRLRRYLGRIR